ncbi:MAG: methyl-accepting chemotaxis protein [Lachnospiraceae bacterium]
MNTNTVRLRRNNETALQLIIVLTVIRMIFSLVTKKELFSTAWMTVQVVLCVILIAGCVVMYKMMSDSELVKFIACGAFVLVAGISLFNNNGAQNVIPLCALIVVTLTYLDEMFSAMCAGLCELFILVKTIIMFVKVDASTGFTWLAVMVLFGAMTYILYVTASNVVRVQKTDQQEIQYHLMYQEEVTQNMVGVVNNGNQHIEALQATLDNFHDATEEVARSVDAISHGVTETALSIENQTDMTAKIQGIIDQLIDVKDHTVSSANHAVSATETGGKLVAQLKEKSDDIAVANKSVTEVALELQAKIESAEEITQLIYQVSSQTNLLALNASIEAARAGEAGRGFSVVADEIRKLADNTKQSIDKITELLQGITELSNHTNQLVNNSVQASEAQAEYIDEVTNAFESIAGVVEELHGNMSSLDSLSTNLSESNNVIIDSLMNQQAASEEMAANAQSSAELSRSNLDDLTNVIGELDEIARIIGSLREIEGMEDVCAASTDQPDNMAASMDMSEEGPAHTGFIPPSVDSLTDSQTEGNPYDTSEDIMEESFDDEEEFFGDEEGFAMDYEDEPEEFSTGYKDGPEEFSNDYEEAPEEFDQSEETSEAFAPSGFTPPSPESLMNGEYDDDWGSKI